jgi:hypothetical protein
MSRLLVTSTEPVVEAVVALAPPPRSRRWVGLSLCVLDAVWSISANYDSVVTPLVVRFAAAHRIGDPVVSPDQIPASDPLPASTLAGYEVDQLTELTNLQRTSSKNGVLKADAVIQFARILCDNGIDTLADVNALLADIGRLKEVEKSLSAVPGHGSFGVRVSYLWMLAGDDDRIKPDRMVLRWLKQFIQDPTVAEAHDLIVSIAPEVSRRLGRPVTPWAIDHAIWNAGRGLPA